MISETFAVGNSPLHALDPRLKIIAATVFSVVVAMSTRFEALSAALFVSLILMGCTRLNFGLVAKRVLLVNSLILFFWLVLPLTMEGTPLYYLGPWPITREGILLSARLTLKANTIFLALIALVSTSSVATLGHALGHIKVPEKLVQLLLLTYRYIFVIEQEYRRLTRAVKVRCFRPNTGLHTYKTYAYMVGMLFVRAGARAERVHQAMRCRGFKGKFYSLHEFKLTPKDYIWAAGLGVTILAIVYLEWAALK
jgi:cobalt/nickel transport system permease protein